MLAREIGHPRQHQLNSDLPWSGSLKIKLTHRSDVYRLLQADVINNSLASEGFGNKASFALIVEPIAFAIDKGRVIAH